MNKYFTVFNIRIYWYSILILFASLIAFALVIYRGKSHKISKSVFIDLYVLCMFYGILCARIYYIIFSWDYYKDNLLEIFLLRNGGLAIYGGLIGGFIALLTYSIRKGINFLILLDIIAPTLLVAQLIGRWGNFINIEAYGFALEGNIIEQFNFLKSLHIPEFIINRMYIDGNYYHPTFLYESIWCLIGFILILSVECFSKYKVLRSTLLYIIWYSFGRCIIEYFRIDSLYIFSFIKVNQLLSLFLFIAGLIVLLNREKISFFKSKDIGRNEY